MKANELMVGDWVRTEHDSTPRQIDWIRTGEVGLLWNKLATPPYLVPIPITPEILEKNGFTRPNERVRYFSESTDYYDVDIHEITDSIWCFEYQNCEAHFPSCLILIAHVHELQHALRLCGIEKEIEL